LCPVDIDIADHKGADRRALHEFSYRYHANAAAAAKCQDFHQSYPLFVI
jgi:acetyl-CoA acetyltransferase